MAHRKGSALRSRTLEELKPSDLTAPVDLLEPLDVLHEHLTESLCRSAFHRVRTTQRERTWSLKALAEFWTAVILRAPKALTQALEESNRGVEGWPHVESTPSAFFQRCQDLNWRFFAELFRDFRRSVDPTALPDFGSQVLHLRKKFPDIVVLDGSRLDQIAHRLKILWGTRETVLPGCLLAA